MPADNLPLVPISMRPSFDYPQVILTNLLQSDQPRSVQNCPDTVISSSEKIELHWARLTKSAGRSSIVSALGRDFISCQAGHGLRHKDCETRTPAMAPVVSC